MPKKTIYEDGPDQFYLGESGLYQRRGSSNDLIVANDELEGFTSWLTDEVDALNTAQAEAKSRAAEAELILNEVSK